VGCRVWRAASVKTSREAMSAPMSGSPESGHLPGTPSQRCNPVIAAVRVRELWNVALGMDYSGLMLAALITFAHFSVSSAINFPNSVDVNDIG
jgi:hypothetical protein